MSEKMIKAKIEGLKKEVLDFIEFLLQKHKRGKNRRKFKFDWEGGLSELKQEYNSVELQHKALEWR